MGYNDNIRNVLKSQGFGGNINDALHHSYTNAGYGGGLNGQAKTARDTFSSKEMLPIVRKIPTLSGTQYGELSSLATLASGDVVEIVFATTTTLPSENIMLTDGDGTVERGYIYQNTTDKLGWNASVISAVTVDGVDAGASLSTDFPNDGKVHTLIATISATADFLAVGCAYTLTESFFEGQLLSLKVTKSSVESNYVFDSGSTTEQYARNSTTSKVDLSNFSVNDWERYIRDAANTKWTAQDGSPILETA